MSNKLVVMLLVMALTATVVSAVVPISLRMRGLGPALVGIVDDEYSDVFYNPAFVNQINGHRLYTNLSNLQGSGEDMFFDKFYYPKMTSYNLLGGITEKNGMKLGALLEFGGINSVTNGSYYWQEISGTTTDVETSLWSEHNNCTKTALNLLWGKQLAGYDFGVLAIPQWHNDTYKSTDTDIEWYTTPSYVDYEYDYSEYISSSKKFATPIVIGIISGSQENELSASLGYGYERETGYIPLDFLESELEHHISSYLESRYEEYWQGMTENNLGGFYLYFNARNKKRFEDYSLTYLGDISYAHQPTTMKFTDTSYSYTFYDTTLTSKRTASALANQSASGPMNRISFGLGFGIEKHFDIMNTNTMLATGFLPKFYTGSTKIKVDPYHHDSTYYRNYPDTLEYTVATVKNETGEIINRFSGLTFTFPIGLEIHPTSRLSLYLGASQNLMFNIKNIYEETWIDSGMVRTFHYTKPNDTTITYPIPANEYEFYRYEDKVIFSSMTSYHYGLGYKINDNVELSLLNFADLTKMYNWVLGVNLKF